MIIVITDRSATNCYIINVALADLAFISFVVPITTAAYGSDDWLYGETLCKVNMYIIYVSTSKVLYFMCSTIL